MQGSPPHFGSNRPNELNTLVAPGLTPVAGVKRGKAKTFVNRCFNHTKGYPGEGPLAPSQMGLLKITTANITGAGSISKLDLSLSDIWCIQEHRLLKKASITRFSNKNTTSPAGRPS